MTQYRFPSSSLNPTLSQQALWALPTPILLVARRTSGMHIVFSNPAFHDLTSYTAPELQGAELSFLYRHQQDQPVLEMLHAALAANESCQVVLQLSAQAGRPFWARLHLAPLPDQSTFVLTLEDVSDDLRNEEALSRQANELQTVAEVGAVVTGILELESLLQDVVDLTKTRFALYHAHVYLLDAEARALTMAAGAGEVGRRLKEQAWAIPLEREQSIVARAARSRQGQVVNNVRQTDNFLPNPLLPDTRAELAVPIMRAEQVLGVLDVQAAQVGYFSDQDVQTYLVLAQQVATAIENARLFTRVMAAQAEAELRLRNTAALQTLSRKLGASLDVNLISDLLLEACESVLGFDYLLLALLDAPDMPPRLTAARGNVGQGVLQFKSATQSTQVKTLFARQTPLLLRHWDADFDPPERRPEDVADRLRIIAPLLVGEQPLGLLEAAYPANADPDQAAAQAEADQLDLLQAFLNQAALALENARRYELSRRQAQREQQLREFSARIQRTYDVDSVVQVAVQEVSRLFNAPAALKIRPAAAKPDAPVREEKEA